MNQINAAFSSFATNGRTLLVKGGEKLSSLQFQGYQIRPIQLGIAAVGIALAITVLVAYLLRKPSSTVSLNPPSQKSQKTNPTPIIVIRQPSEKQNDVINPASANLQSNSVQESDSIRAPQPNSPAEIAAKVEQARAQVIPPPQISSIETLKKPTNNFNPFSFELSFHESKEKIELRSDQDLEDLMQRIVDTIAHGHVEIRSDSTVEAKMKILQRSKPGNHLRFSLSKYKNRIIIIRPKPIEVEKISADKLRNTYASGVIEEFAPLKHNSAEGIRTFPDGTKEVGVFYETGELSSGYRVRGDDGSIDFINPKGLLKDDKFLICDVEGKLVVIRNSYTSEHRHAYSVSDRSIEEVLEAACQRETSGGESVREILSHPAFSEGKRAFLAYALAPDESGTPRLFHFSNQAVCDLMELASQNKDFKPLSIIDPATGRNIFTQAAHWKSDLLLSKLAKLFPDAFLKVGQEVIEKLLQKGSYHVHTITRKFIELGGELDLFHRLGVLVASRTKPHEEFKEQFSSLTTDQQRILYDVAFLYKNCFIHEAPETAVAPDQYSINLMWINKKPMPKDQEFLFGDGEIEEEKKEDFRKRFIQPVSKWAKAHPGSSIDVWVDSAMATSEAVERSFAALKEALSGAEHAAIQFRDVRLLDVVKANPEAFTEKMPVYFRVDLLRAIAADHVLRNKEKKLFVYGDVDMDPMTSEELFDKRTVNYLNEDGFVMAKGGWLGFENGFQILNGEHAQFMDSHRKVLIDLSVEMAVQCPAAIGEQQIYDTYPAMIAHLLEAGGRYGELKLRGKKAQDPSLRLKQFRYDRFRTTAHNKIPFKKPIKLSVVVPTKPVRLPPSHFG